MPKHVHQPDNRGDVPTLNDNAQAAAKLRMGTNKWYRIRYQIEHVTLDGRDYWTDAALLKFIHTKTVKPPKLKRRHRDLVDEVRS